MNRARLLILSLSIFLIQHVSSSPTDPNHLLRRQSGTLTSVSIPSPSTTSSAVLFTTQYKNPKEVFSVLLLIGGDIVQKAIAQLHGHFLTPICFSFGWITYAFYALGSAFGDGTLMPVPDIPSRVINSQTRNSRSNESFLIGRLIRDLEMVIEKGLRTRLKREGKIPIDGRRLVITIFKTGAQSLPGHSAGDKLWWSFLIFGALQFGLAAVPLALPRRNWSILLMTGLGSILAIVTSSLPQWTEEKFACRNNSKETYILMRGNGHKHVIVIENRVLQQCPEVGKRLKGHSLNLEDLAVAHPASTPYTKYASTALAVLWIFFLITTGRLDEDAWYLLGVGAVGMAHNVISASWSRTPEAHGVPLRRAKSNSEGARDNPYDIEQIGDGNMSTMRVLQKAETDRPGLGIALLETYFPGDLNDEENEFWRSSRSTLKDREQEQKRIRDATIYLPNKDYEILPIPETRPRMAKIGKWFKSDSSKITEKSKVPAVEQQVVVTKSEGPTTGVDVNGPSGQALNQTPGRESHHPIDTHVPLNRPLSHTTTTVPPENETVSQVASGIEDPVTVMRRAQTFSHPSCTI